MKKIIIAFTFLFLIISSMTFAKDNTSGWDYQKEILVNEDEEYKAIFLDEEVYKYSNEDLSDIRIINNQGEFVPYYITNDYIENIKSNQIAYESNKILNYMKDNDYYYDFKIIKKSDSEDILANKLLFKISENYFLKNIKLYGSYDNKVWDFLKSDKIYRTYESEKLNVSLEEVYKYDYYRIIFIDDVEKTNIEDLKAIYNKNELILKNYNKTKEINYSINSIDKKSIIEIFNKDLLKINSIKLISDDDYKRSYKVYYKNNDEENNEASFGEIYQFKINDFKIEKTNIDIFNNIYPYINSDLIKIEIYNEDNNPINIKDIDITYSIDKIVFKGNKDDKYKLLFGNNDIKKPSYDIINFKNNIENENQEIVKLSKLEIINTKTDSVESKTIDLKLILNIVIGIISIMLIIIISKKMKHK